MAKPQLLFGTNNLDKLKEIRELVGQKFEVLSLADIGLDMDVDETEDTLVGNANLKSKAYFDVTQIPCFSDDSGLEVDALDGAPGVYSARFAGEQCSYQDNVDKMLRVMQEQTIRSARFRTVISFYDGQQFRHFEGAAEGEILQEERGKGGFGYDPIFLPENQTLTFAEMSADQKNKISHRGKAVKKFVEYLFKLESE